MKLFRRTKKNANAELFTDYIANIQELANYYQEALDKVKVNQPDVSITVYNTNGDILHICNRKMAEFAVNRHLEWIGILRKMQQGKNITCFEHESLLEIPFFQNKMEVTHYAYVEKSKKNVNF